MIVVGVFLVLVPTRILAIESILSNLLLRGSRKPPNGNRKTADEEWLPRRTRLSRELWTMYFDPTNSEVRVAFTRFMGIAFVAIGITQFFAN